MDTFIRDHLGVIKGQLCISIANAKKSKEIGQSEQSAVAPIEINRSSNDENYEKRRSQRQIDRKNRSKFPILNPLNYANADVPILPNGSDNLGERRQMIEVINTCGFDSIASVFACLYFDHKAFQNIVDQSISSDFARLIQLMYQQRRIVEAHERLRYEILKSILKNTSCLVESGNLIHIDAQTAISYMFTRLCNNGNGFIASKTEMATCESCGHQSEVNCSYINADNFDIRNLQENIEQITDRQCRNCLKIISSIHIEYNAIVAIETEQVHCGENGSNRYTIDEITKTIRMNQEGYELIGIIEHQTNQQHFVAHVKRHSNKWFTYDDIIGKEFECSVENPIAVHMIFYKKKHMGTLYNIEKHFV